MFKDDLLKGKRMLVTGGGTGLGKVMAEAFLQHGATVYIWGRRGKILEQAAEEMMAAHGGTVVPQAVDIRGAADVEQAVETIFAQGPLDGLVNNAAGNFISRTKDLSSRGFDAIASIVFHGTFYVTHAVGTRWIEAGRGGNIISILTTWVWTGSPFVVPSAMSKSGVNAMTQSLAVEWAPMGIRVNAIAPGPFPTKGAWDRLSPGQATDDAASQMSNPMGRVGEMDELANLAMYLMADGSAYINGQTIAIDGGQYLVNNGSFGMLSNLSDDDWERMRDMIRSANDTDKADRTA